MDKESSKQIVLLISTAGAFITPFMSNSVTVATQIIGEEFNMNAVLLSWISTSYILAAAIFLVPFGRIADMYGRKRIYLLGISIVTVSSLMCAVSNSSTMLILSRALQGIGSSMIFGTGVAMLTSAFPAEERGKVLGINVAVTYIGLSLGPVVGGKLTQYLGWRSIFLVCSVIGIVIIALIISKLKQEWAYAREEKFDFIGSIIYGLSLFCIIYGFSILPGYRGGCLIFLGVVGIIFFGMYESRIESPVLKIGLFSNNRPFVFSSLAALINYSATSAVAFILSLYLQDVKGFTPGDTGLIMIVQPLVQAVCSPFAGRFSDKIEPRKLASIGMAISAAGLFLMVFLNINTGIVFIIAASILLGIGFGLFSSPNTNAIMSSVDKKVFGIASGMVGTMRLIGQALSMGIVTMIFALYIGSARITPGLNQPFLISIRIIFTILTVLSVAGIFASLARGKVHEQNIV